METDEQDGDDESSQDQELPSENDNSQSEDSVGGGDNELENGVGQGGDNSGTKGHPNQMSTTMEDNKRLFTFQFNNMGKADFSLIKEEPRQIRFNEGHLRLSDRSYLSLDWEPEVKKKHFHEGITDDFEMHESMEYKPQKKAFFKLKDCIELFTTRREARS